LAAPAPTTVRRCRCRLCRCSAGRRRWPPPLRALLVRPAKRTRGGGGKKKKRPKVFRCWAALFFAAHTSGV
jgi:hypothetical protein